MYNPGRLQGWALLFSLSFSLICSCVQVCVNILLVTRRGLTKKIFSFMARPRFFSLIRLELLRVYSHSTHPLFVVLVLGAPNPSWQGENGNLKDICSLGLDEWAWVSKVGSFTLPSFAVHILALNVSLTHRGAYIPYFCRARRLCPNGTWFAMTSGRFQLPIPCFLLGFSVRSLPSPPGFSSDIHFSSCFFCIVSFFNY